MSKEAQDKIVIGITSKKLLEYGWPKEAQNSLKSITASYLTGLLLGIKILKNKLEQPIVDLGMTRIIHKSRAFAFIKGLIDSGIKIECKKEDFPEENRINRKDIPFKEILKRISDSYKSEKQDLSDKEIKLKIEKEN